MKKVIEAPKTIEEYNKWTKKKRIAYIEQQKFIDLFFDEKNVEEDIRISNLSMEEYLTEVFKEE